MWWALDSWKSNNPPSGQISFRLGENTYNLVPNLGNYKSKHPLPRGSGLSPDPLTVENAAFEIDMYPRTPMQTAYHPTIAWTSYPHCSLQKAAVPEIRAMLALRKILGEDVPDSILVEVIDSYLEDTPKLLRSLSIAAEIGDWSAIRALAHTLKPTSATIGALSLFQLSKELEAMVGGDNDRVALVLKVQQLLCEYEQVEKQLQAERSSCQL